MVSRYVELLDDVDETVEKRVAGYTLEGKLQFASPDEQATIFLFYVSIFIDDIIRIAAERVDRLDRLAFWRRKEEDWKQKIAASGRTQLGQAYVYSMSWHLYYPFNDETRSDALSNNESAGRCVST